MAGAAVRFVGHATVGLRVVSEWPGWAFIRRVGRFAAGRLVKMNGLNGPAD